MRLDGARARPTARVLTLILGAAVLLGVLTGCTGDHFQSPQGSDTARESPAPTSLAAPEQAAALAAYTDYWTAFAAAANPPDPDAAGLRENAIDPELARARQTLNEWSTDSALFEGVYEHVDTSVSVTGQTAVVQDCMSLTGRLIDSVTKTVKSVTNPQPAPVRAELKLIDRVWKVENVSTGTQSCSPRPTETPTSNG